MSFNWFRVDILPNFVGGGGYGSKNWIKNEKILICIKRVNLN